MTKPMFIFLILKLFFLSFKKLIIEKAIKKTETNEFSAVCPFSGLPDLAKVRIEYFPAGKKCIELKSLKYYFTSFRNVGIYQEGATKRIYDDLSSILETKKIQITTIYNIRGGFKTTCVEGNINH